MHRVSLKVDPNQSFYSKFKDEQLSYTTSILDLTSAFLQQIPTPISSFCRLCSCFDLLCVTTNIFQCLRWDTALQIQSSRWRFALRLFAGDFFLGGVCGWPPGSERHIFICSKQLSSFKSLRLKIDTNSVQPPMRAMCQRCGDMHVLLFQT